MPSPRENSPNVAQSWSVWRWIKQFLFGVSKPVYRVDHIAEFKSDRIKDDAIVMVPKPQDFGSSRRYYALYSVKKEKTPVLCLESASLYAHNLDKLKPNAEGLVETNDQNQVFIDDIIRTVGNGRPVKGPLEKPEESGSLLDDFCRLFRKPRALLAKEVSNLKVIEYKNH